MMLSNRIKALCVSLAALCLITGCSGRHCGNYTRVMVTVRTENGGYYDISVPRKFIP